VAREEAAHGAGRVHRQPARHIAGLQQRPAGLAARGRAMGEQQAAGRGDARAARPRAGAAARVSPRDTACTQTGPAAGGADTAPGMPSACAAPAAWPGPRRPPPQALAQVAARYSGSRAPRHHSRASHSGVARRSAVAYSHRARVARAPGSMRGGLDAGVGLHGLQRRHEIGLDARAAPCACGPRNAAPAPAWCWMARHEAEAVGASRRARRRWC
jgi:hypothetical protein